MADVIRYQYRRKDGTVYEGDVNGDPITSQTPAEVRSVGGSGRDVSEINMGTPQSKIEAPTWKDYVFQHGGRYIPESLAQIGGMAGALTKNPRYSALGTAVGSALGSELKRADPELFGEYNANQEGINALINSAVDPVLKGVTKAGNLVFPSARQELYGQLAEYFKPRGQTAEVSAAIRADPNFERTVGQSNPIAGFIENVFNAKGKQAVVDRQKATIAKEILPNFAETEPVMRTVQKQASSNVGSIRKKRSDLYEDFKPAIDYPGNALQVQRVLPPAKRQVGFNQPPPGPRYEDITLKGRIPLNNSLNIANTIGDQIDEVLKDPSLVNTTPGLQLQQIKNGMDAIRNTETFVDPVTKKPLGAIGEFNKLKETRDALTNFVESEQFDAFRSRLGGSLTSLRNAIGKDMDEGVKSWGPNSYGRYRKAQDYAKFVATKIDSKYTNELTSAGVDPNTTLTKVGDKMLSDPQFTRQAVVDIGSREPVTKLFMDKLSRHAYNPNTGVLDTEAGLKFLTDNAEIARIAVPSKTLSEFKRFLNKNSIVGPYSEGLNIGNRLRYGANGIALGVGAMNFAAGGNIPFGAKAATIGLLGPEAIKTFTEKVLLDPKMARIAAGQLDIPDKSLAAKRGTAALLSALKTAQVEIMSPDGERQKGHINNQGKIVIDKSSPE